MFATILVRQKIISCQNNKTKANKQTNNNSKLTTVATTTNNNSKLTTVATTTTTKTAK